jgi:hypothetical protein
LYSHEAADCRNESEALEALIDLRVFCVGGRFDKFNISPLSLKAIHEVMGFKTMTVVQDATLPVILKGKISLVWTFEKVIYCDHVYFVSHLLLKIWCFLSRSRCAC